MASFRVIRFARDRGPESRDYGTERTLVMDTYNLSIWFHSSEALERGVQALGSDPSFDEWYVERSSREVEPTLGAVIQPDGVESLGTTASLPTGDRGRARLSVVGLDDLPNESGSWEDPIELWLWGDVGVDDWRRGEQAREVEQLLEAWLREIANRVFRVAPFHLTTIWWGELVPSYDEVLSHLRAVGRNKRGFLEVGVLENVDGELQWHAPVEWSAIPIPMRPCPHCGKRLKTASGLGQHMAAKHGAVSRAER
jgi:hypothetical protein